MMSLFLRCYALLIIEGVSKGDVADCLLPIP